MAISEFGEADRRASRNPLGIIALFLLLVYGIAALLLGVSIHDGNGEQRWALTVFVVVFPLLVLLVFYRLVSQHHTKLYAPGEYRDEALFARDASSEEKIRRIIDSDLAELVASAAGAQNAPEEPDAPARAAKELVLYELEGELGVRFRRDMVLGDRGDLVFDGVARKGKDLIVVDVKHVLTVHTRLSRIDATLQRMFDAGLYVESCRPGTRLRPIVVVVYPCLEAADRKQVEERFRARSMPVEVRFYALDDLKRRWLTPQGAAATNRRSDAAIAATLPAPAPPRRHH